MLWQATESAHISLAYFCWECFSWNDITLVKCKSKHVFIFKLALKTFPWNKQIQWITEVYIVLERLVHSTTSNSMIRSLSNLTSGMTLMWISLIFVVVVVVQTLKLATLRFDRYLNMSGSKLSSIRLVSQKVFSGQMCACGRQILKKVRYEKPNPLLCLKWMCFGLKIIPSPHAWSLEFTLELHYY